MSFTTLLQNGIEFKFTSSNEKANSITLPEWFHSLSDKLELFGLDTVFRVPILQWTDEVYIAEDWGTS